MLRSLIAFGLVCTAAGTASAGVVEGTLPNATLSWPRVKIAPSFSADESIAEPADSDQFRQHLNLAACTCSAAADPAIDTSLYFELALTGTTTTGLPLEVLVGTECNNDTLFDTNCRKIDGAGLDDVNTIAQNETFIAVPLYDLINARPDQKGMPCNQANGGSAFVWAAVDTDQNGDLDYYDSQAIDLDLFSDVAGYDTKPPPLPDNLRATGGEGSIELAWDIPDANAQDLFAFQAFCMDASGNPVGDGGTPLYSTTETVCGIPAPQDLTRSEIEGEGAEVTAAPAAFTNLDKAFLCGTQESGTATSLTITGLENDQPYTVALVAVDFYGNPTGTFFSRTVIPKPVTDFWEDIHDRGGKVEGGFCSTGGADALPGLLIPLALVWGLRRRRAAARRLASLALLGGLFATGTARADDFAPYWEDPSNTTDSGASIYEDHVKWHVGIKLGPYTPAIDDQFASLNAANGTTTGPYAAMFGNYYTDDDGDGTLEAHDKRVYQFLPMLDVERIVWSGSGQIGVGGTLGYMQKSAFAYAEDSTPSMDPFRVRTRASSNTFKLIPFALTATYRATQLDDLWGIPVVPYLRGGLSYYVWWMKGPSGDLSKICTDGTTSSDCKGNKAYGGSLGFQGSLGLSIRAERIDRDAARSMKQSGIYHAGFYVELMAAVVNGFGNDKKLSVGDKTWFAGFDFEF